MRYWSTSCGLLCRKSNDRLFCLARLQILILMNERYSRLLLTKGIVHLSALLWRASSAEEDAHDIHVHVVDVRVFFVKIQISTYVGSNIVPIFVSYEIRRRHLAAFPFWAPSGGLLCMAWVCLSSIQHSLTEHSLMIPP